MKKIRKKKNFLREKKKWNNKNSKNVITLTEEDIADVSIKLDRNTC